MPRQQSMHIISDKINVSNCVATSKVSFDKLEYFAVIINKKSDHQYILRLKVHGRVRQEDRGISE